MANNHPATRRALMKTSLALTVIANAGISRADGEPVCADPLGRAIEAYRLGMVAFDAISEADWVVHGGEDVVVEQTFGKPLLVLQRWAEPALNHRGAVDALRFAYEENRRRLADPVIDAMLSAALAYFEGGRHGHDV